MDSYENALTALTLDDIIRMQTVNRGGPSKSLQECIENCKQKEKNNHSPPKTSGEVNPVDDIYKSLDTIIQEKKITSPVSSNQRKNGVIRELEVVQGSSQGSPPTKNGPPIVKLRDRMDPLTHSLSDLIVKPATTESNQRTKRNHDDKDQAAPMEVDSDGKLKGYRGYLSRPILTPYRAVSFLREAGMLIELRTGGQEEPTGDGSHKWRCEVSCGLIKGISESSRKVVAREMACKEFLVHLRESFPDAKIPRYEIAGELLIDPKVFHMIERVKNEKGIDVCHEVKVKIRDPKMTQKNIPTCTYLCTYYVGTEECVGESSLIEYAKLTAAKLAYEFLSGKELYPTKYYVGEEDCPANNSYIFKESEVFQILGVTTDGQPHIDFPQDQFAIDDNEGRREVARMKLSENFKRARKEDENGRRNMRVVVSSTSTLSSSSTSSSSARSGTNYFKDVEIKQEPGTSRSMINRAIMYQCSDASQESESGSIARRVSIINRFARQMDQEDDTEEDF